MSEAKKRCDWPGCGAEMECDQHEPTIQANADLFIQGDPGFVSSTGVNTTPSAAQHGEVKVLSEETEDCCGNCFNGVSVEGSEHLVECQVGDPMPCPPENGRYPVMSRNDDSCEDWEEKVDCTVPNCTGVMILESGRREKSCTNRTLHSILRSPSAAQHGELEKPKPFSVERMQAELDASKDLSRIGNMQVPKEYCHRLLVTYAAEKERADKAEVELEVKQQKVIRQKKELAFLNGRVDEYIDNYKYECRKTLKLKADYAVLHGVLQKLHEIVAHNEPPGRDLPLEWIMEEAQKLLASLHPGADLIEKAAWHDRVSGGIAHKGCNYLAVTTCFKCGWSNPDKSPFYADVADATINELRERVAALEGGIDDILHSSPCHHAEDYHRVSRDYMGTLNHLINGSEPPIKETPSQELARRASVRMVEQSLTYGQAVEYVLKTQPALAKAYREFTLKGIVKNE